MKVRTGERIQYEISGDVLKVSGVLVRPGTFTVMDGDTIEFTDEAIRDIFENIQGNIPLKLTHMNDKIVGYATKFTIDDSATLRFTGYVFDNDVITKIVRDGYDNVSGEFVLEMEDGTAVGGILSAIAFVTLPAVPDANIEEAKIVALSKNMVEVKKVEGGKEELITKIVEQIKARGIVDENVLKVVTEVLNEVLQTYPYPYPKPQETYPSPVPQEEIEQLKAELQKYKKFYEDSRAKELERLISELKSMGIKNPSEIVSDIENLDCKIGLLQKLKENIVLSSVQTSSSVPVNVVEDRLASLAKALNASIDDVRRLFGGGSK